MNVNFLLNDKWPKTRPRPLRGRGRDVATPRSLFPHEHFDKNPNEINGSDVDSSLHLFTVIQLINFHRLPVQFCNEIRSSPPHYIHLFVSSRTCRIFHNVHLYPARNTTSMVQSWNKHGHYYLEQERHSKLIWPYTDSIIWLEFCYVRITTLGIEPTTFTPFRGMTNVVNQKSKQ